MFCERQRFVWSILLLLRRNAGRQKRWSADSWLVFKNACVSSCCVCFWVRDCARHLSSRFSAVQCSRLFPSRLQFSIRFQLIEIGKNNFFHWNWLIGILFGFLVDKLQVLLYPRLVPKYSHSPMLLFSSTNSITIHSAPAPDGCGFRRQLCRCVFAT